VNQQHLAQVGGGEFPQPRPRPFIESRRNVVSNVQTTGNTNLFTPRTSDRIQNTLQPDGSTVASVHRRPRIVTERRRVAEQPALPSGTPIYSYSYEYSYYYSFIYSESYSYSYPYEYEYEYEYDYGESAPPPMAPSQNTQWKPDWI
jgi:hypothetical protein